MSLFNFKSSPDTPPGSQDNSSILVVDDDQFLNDLYVDLLKTEGYAVTSAFNGKDAMTIITKKHPQLILLDIMMPGMNGNEVLAALQENEETKRIPVIILTNNANMENMANAKLYNAYKYLIKSNIDPSEIIKEVKKALTSQDFAK